MLYPWITTYVIDDENHIVQLEICDLLEEYMRNKYRNTSSEILIYIVLLL